VEGIATAGKDLVGVGLVPDIPDDLVLGGVEAVVQRDAQFHATEVGGEVSAGLGHRLQQKGADLIGERDQLLTFQLFQVIGTVDLA